MKQYHGTYRAGEWRVLVRLVGLGVGETRPLTHHVKHSPDGFSWGYTGSGPSELARCLLIDALGEDDPYPGMYHAFKFDNVATWPTEEDWMMTDDEIRAWVEDYDQTAGSGGEVERRGL